MLTKRDIEFLRAGRKAAHEEHNRRAFAIYQQGLLDGTRQPKKVRIHPTSYLGNKIGRVRFDEHQAELDLLDRQERSRNRRSLDSL